MDECERKIKELRTYVPFLTKMIDKLEQTGDRSKEAQLSKMKSLKSILTTTNKNLKLDTLIKCEDVLQKLYAKVEGAPVVKTANSPIPPQQQRRGSHDRSHSPNDNPHQQRRNPPDQATGGGNSFSSYLQQVYDNQHKERFQNTRAGPGGGGNNPWMMNEHPRQPHPASMMNNDLRHPHPSPWQQQQQQHPQHRPGFQDRPEPWGVGHPPFQPGGPRGAGPNFRQPVRFRPPGPFDNNMQRRPTPFLDQHRPPFQDNNRPPFQDHSQQQHFNEQRPSPFWDQDRGGQGRGGRGGGRDFHNRDSFDNRNHHQDQQQQNRRFDGQLPPQHYQQQQEERFQRTPGGPHHQQEDRFQRPPGGPLQKEERFQRPPGGPFSDRFPSPDFNPDRQHHYPSGSFRKDEQNLRSFTPPQREESPIPPKGILKKDELSTAIPKGILKRGGSPTVPKGILKNREPSPVPKGILKRVESPVAPKGILKDSIKKSYDNEWNKNVRGPTVQESPSSPGPPVQEDYDTPMSPDIVELDPEPEQVSSKKFVPTDRVDTPQSPDQEDQLTIIEDTPKSPEPETTTTPVSPTPKSPTEPLPHPSDLLLKENPKVIPLERDQRQRVVHEKFDIRGPKDWHRGLRGHLSSSASPSSECSDDSDKGAAVKRLQVVESSPASVSSSPASPASGYGESLMNRPSSSTPLPAPVPSLVPSAQVPVPSLPTPVPAQLPTPLPVPAPMPTTTKNTADGSHHNTTVSSAVTDKSPKVDPLTGSNKTPLDVVSSRNKSEFQQRMHPSRPSRPPRPILLDSPPQNDPSFMRHNTMSQPRLQNPAFQPNRPPRPNLVQPQQPPMMVRPQQVHQKKPSTYGEYRRLREMQLQRQQHHHQQQQQGQQNVQGQQLELKVKQQTPPPAMSRRDPRRPPKSNDPKAAGSSVEAAKQDTSSSSSSSLGKFKIPKKKKLIEPELELFKPDKIPQKLEKSTKGSTTSSSKKEVVKKQHAVVVQETMETHQSVIDPGSDSEPELKIAESDEEQQQQTANTSSSSISDNKKVVDQNESKNDASSSEENKSDAKCTEEQDRGQLTKAMLQNIVASIDTKEASKLLERATRLLNSDDGHKLSLKQLLVGDSDSEEENDNKVKSSDASTKPTCTTTKKRKKSETSEQSAPPAEQSPITKKTTTSKKPAKPKPAPTPGTRRSRRLQVEPEVLAKEEPPPEAEKEKVTEEQQLPVADSDDDENQLVIDEAHSPHQDELPSSSEVEIQQSTTTSTNNVISSAKKSRGRPPKGTAKASLPHLDEALAAEQSVVKEEDPKPVDEMDEDLEAKVLSDQPIKTKPERMKMARMSRMAPKSKTWFPNRDTPATNVKKLVKSPPSISMEQQAIKKEPKDPDLKVFNLTGEVVVQEHFMSQDIRAKTETCDTKIKVVSRLERLKCVFSKINSSDNSNNETTTTGVEDISSSSSKKIKDHEATFNKDNIPKQNDNAVELEEALKQPLPDILIGGSSPRKKSSPPRIFKPNVTMTEEVDLEETSKDFVDVVKSIISEQNTTLLDQQKAAHMAQIDLSLAEKKGLNSLANNQAMYQNIPSSSNMFHCMSQFCSFSTNLAQEFTQHLYEVHSMDKKKNRHGWLKCCYCMKKLENPEYLTYHIIKSHAKPLQCQHCPLRESSLWSLLIHQTQSHPGLPQGFLKAPTLPQLENNQMQNNKNSQTGSKGTVSADHRKSSSLPPYSALANRKLNCQESQCQVQATNPDQLSHHLFLDHHNAKPFTDFQCAHCLEPFSSMSRLVIHVKLVHQKKSQPNLVIRHVDQALTMESDEDEEGEAIDKNHNTTLEEVVPEQREEGELEKDGLEGQNLFKCGNELGGLKCEFSGETVSDFRDHVAICEFSVDALYLTCVHCQKQFKHVATLVEHLKTHGLKRYSCSLCSAFKHAVPHYVKNHLRLVHNVSQTKVMPFDGLKTNPDKDFFAVMPKNALPKGIKVSRFGRSKDTFSPSEIDDIPRISMLRNVIRCSVCDFTTKVRMNLIKHLRLHLRSSSTEGGKIKEVPFITAVNPVEIPDDKTNYERMMTNLDLTEEEKMKQPMSEEELNALPKLVPENQRNACPDLDCNYVTVDTMMLLAHMDHLHPEFNHNYRCPHCQNNNPDAKTKDIDNEKINPNNVVVPFEDVEFHLRCHGDLLFKCFHCPYYNWQKRIAEKHVQEAHPGAKIFVRDVRMEAEQIKKNKILNQQEELNRMKKLDSKPEVVVKYLPYKCGLCDQAAETIEVIREHCSTVHEIKNQFKCLFCDTASDNKSEMENHCDQKHSTSVLMRIFYVDGTGTSTVTSSTFDPALEEKREPLWRRDMPGLKHIRGILYEEYPDMVYEDHAVEVVGGGRGSTSSSFKTGSSSADRKQNKDDKSTKVIKEIDEVDNFSMKCKDCGLQKKTIKGLKMHIKLLHLRTGKFLCKRCPFSANMMNSITTHYKIKHPEAADQPDFEERSDDKMIFSHEFWKESWNIPTLAERKAMVMSGKRDLNEIEDLEDVLIKVKKGGGKRKAVSSPSSTNKKSLKIGNKKAKKRGAKRRYVPDDPPEDLLEMSTSSSSVLVSSHDITRSGSESHNSTETAFKRSASLTSSSGSAAAGVEKPLNVMEISPFEQVPTYKCQYCSKRTNILEKMETHLKIEHANKNTTSTNPESGNVSEVTGYKKMTRDQVVDMLTLNLTATNSEGVAQFICYYCEDVVGSIHDLKTHFTNEHFTENKNNQAATTGSGSDANAFKVKRVTESKKTIPGYLECQLCGYLTPGFDRSKQRIHFHDEHPMAPNINCSKYTLRVKTTGTGSSKVGGGGNSNQDHPHVGFDPSKYVGMVMKCPKEDCPFENTSNAAMNAHLRKHTQTFKCGHCALHGFPNSSEFHRHSAMVHGDKIPDLVKDPEAEAAFEALRGLLEASLQRDYEQNQVALAKQLKKKRTKGLKISCRKSTCPSAKFVPPPPKKNRTGEPTARKSTGPNAMRGEFSYYGVDQPKIDFKDISTRMSIGGMEITLNASKMAGLVNLIPKVMVEDCEKK